MANRHLSRATVMQTLFEWDFNHQQGHTTDLPETLERNAREFAPGMGDFSFMQELLDGVCKYREKIDEVIEKAAPDWPLEKIATVDRNILRIGLYELLYGDRSQVPAKVAINEAIELAKKFGGENSGRFVNGVLGAVYKEIGEPGKNDTGKKKQNVQDVPYEKMPIEHLGGAVVYAEEGGEYYMALVHDIFGHWTLSKGHIEGDDVAQGTKKKVKQELGIDVSIEEPLGNNEYIASDPEKGKIRKQVNYYLARANFGDLTLEEGGGLDDAQWFRLRDIIDLNIYDDILPIITKGINIILKTDNAERNES